MSKKIRTSGRERFISFLKTHKGILLAGLLSCLFALSGTLISLHRFWQYEVFYYDFGIFDMALWNVSRFNPPVIEHFVVGGKWIFADHFNPSLFLLTPLYWIVPRSEILLVSQAIAVSASGFVLYLIGQKVVKNVFYSLTILLCYFLFVGLQNAVISDFHEVTVATLFFLLTYYFFLTKKLSLYWIFLILTLGFKESNFLLGIGIGISLFILDRTQWKTALATCILSLVWGILAIQIIIPYFSGKEYSYQLSDTKNPVLLGTRFFDNTIKVQTLFYSFLSFGFLPILSPAFWALLLQDFGSRFIPPFLTISWRLGLHYSALTAAMLGLSSLFSLKFLAEKIKKPVILKVFCLLLILNSLFLYRVVLRGPFALSYNHAFYNHTKDFVFLDTLIEKVPDNTSVMTHNNLATRFTHQDLMLLKPKCDECVLEDYEVRNPEYIVLDTRQGQNPNNYYGAPDLGKLAVKLTGDKKYTIYYQSGDQYIFKKK